MNSPSPFKQEHEDEGSNKNKQTCNASRNEGESTVTAPLAIADRIVALAERSVGPISGKNKIGKVAQLKACVKAPRENRRI